MDIGIFCVLYAYVHIRSYEIESDEPLATLLVRFEWNESHPIKRLRSLTFELFG